MKKPTIAYFLLTLSLTIPSQAYLKNLQKNLELKPLEYISTSNELQLYEEGILLAEQQIILEEPKQIEAAAPVVSINTTSVVLSRGGTGLTATQAQPSKPEKSIKNNQPVKQASTSNNYIQNKQTTYSSNVELLDWWKTGRTVFSVGTVAEIKDVYTGKTFMAKRTMGTNHADTEALTKKDTETIKSIWGGFTWARRPVILNINGKQYAASMSAMPHAGMDSSPAYAVINNRSDGYGTGENLDVIKNNGMDGHFDIHFLNSTRHKDGKEDPQHQAAVLKAAAK